MKLGFKKSGLIGELFVENKPHRFPSAILALLVSGCAKIPPFCLVPKPAIHSLCPR